MRKTISFLLFSIAVVSVSAQDNFTEIPTNINGINLGSAEWVDYNSDGLLDIFITGFKIGDGEIDNATIFQNQGHGNFNVVDINNISRFLFGDQDWGDLNNDGLMDLVFQGTTGAINDHISKIYINNLDTFTEIDNNLSKLDQGDIKIVDIDSDGDNDIFTIGFKENGRVVAEVYSNKNLEFTKVYEFPISGGNGNGDQANSSAWYDFDNDGDSDALIAYSTFSDGFGVKYFENKGNFAFDEITSFEIPQYSYSSIDVFDFNNDNKLDFAISGTLVNNIASSTSAKDTVAYLSILRNDGKNKFTEVFTEELGVFFGSINCGDFNSDGLSDILLNGSGNGFLRTFTLVNNGNESFSLDLVSNNGTNSGGALWGRLDSTSNLDIYQFGSTSLSSSDAISRLFENSITSSNEKPSIPSNFTYEIRNDTLIVEWQPSTDDLTSNKGISYETKFGTSSQNYNLISGSSNENGYRKIYRLGNNGLKTSFFYPNLQHGTFYLKVQSIDNAFNGSSYSDEIEICSPRATLNDSMNVCLFDSVLLDPGTFDSYSWNTGEDSQTICIKDEGWYSVVVENSFGCISKDSTHITIHPLPNPSLKDSLSTCELDSVLLDPGTFDSYFWSTGEVSQTIYAKEEGWYSVVVENSFGCISKDSTHLTIHPLPNPSLKDSLSTCELDSVLLDPGTFDSYFWSTGEVSQTIYAKEEGWRSVEVQNSFGCIYIDSTYISISPLPTLSLTDSTISENDFLEIDPGEFVSYEWSNGFVGRFLQINADTLDIGENPFSILVVDSNGCSASANFFITVEEALGIQTIPEGYSIKIDNNYLTIKKPTSDRHLNWQVVSLNGRITFKSKNTMTEQTMYLKSGIYLVRMNHQQGTTTFKLLIK